MLEKGSENMELVIKLSDDVYTRLFDNGTEINRSDQIEIETAIRRGIPIAFNANTKTPTDRQARNVGMGCEYKEQETKMGQWIPVSEMLPDEGHSVLVTRITDDNCKYVRIASYQGDCWMDNTDEFNKPNPHKVIAWQPFSKPYEPQERSDKE